MNKKIIIIGILIGIFILNYVYTDHRIRFIRNYDDIRKYEPHPSVEPINTEYIVNDVLLDQQVSESGNDMEYKVSYIALSDNDKNEVTINYISIYVICDTIIEDIKEHLWLDGYPDYPIDKQIVYKYNETSYKNNNYKYRDGYTVYTNFDLKGINDMWHKITGLGIIANVTVSNDKETVTGDIYYYFDGENYKITGFNKMFEYIANIQNRVNPKDCVNL